MLWFCFTALYDWRNKLVPPTCIQPIGCKTKIGHLFFHAWRLLRVFASSSYWFILLLTFVVIGFVLVLRHPVENCSICYKVICLLHLTKKNTKILGGNENRTEIFVKNVFKFLVHVHVHTPHYLKFQNSMFHSKVLQFNTF